MLQSNSFYQLFSANFKMLFRNYRSIFFNLALPILLYVVISKVVGFIPGVLKGDYDYADYLLPGIIAMTLMQTGIFSVAYWLIDLKSNGTLKRFLVTPLSPFQMIGSVVASRLVLILIQVILLILVGLIVFGAKVSGSFIAIAILFTLGGAVFLSLGFLVSSLANNYEEAAPMTTIVNLLFTFLGNIFFTTAKFPPFVREVSRLLPVTFLSEGIRDNFLQPNWPLRNSLPSIVGLLAWLIILLLLNASLFKTKED